MAATTPAPPIADSPARRWLRRATPDAPARRPIAQAPPLPRRLTRPDTISIGLRRGFRYVHQPLVDDADGIPLLGNADVVEAFKERIVHSAGGSFLVTGFRGVGKTTVIGRALAELRRSGDVAVLPVTLNVARPRTLEELLFEIIRRVFETLKDEELLEQMGPRVQRELLLAYARTSMSFNETRSKGSNERSRGLALGAPRALLRGAGAPARLAQDDRLAGHSRPPSSPTPTPTSSTTSCALSGWSSAARLPGATARLSRRRRRQPATPGAASSSS